MLDELLKEEVTKERISSQLKQMLFKKVEDDDNVEVQLETNFEKVGKHLLSIFSDILNETKRSGNSTTKSGGAKKEDKAFGFTQHKSILDSSLKESIYDNTP